MQQKLQQVRTLLEGNLGQQFDDPKFRQAAIEFDRILNDGEDGGSLSGPDLYEFASRLFVRELQKGVGDKLPDGSTIASKRIVQAFEDGDNIVLELDIHATRPDGTEFDYKAPVTRGRTSEDTDEVLMIPIREVRDRLRGASMLARGLEQGGGRAAVLAQLQGEDQEMGLQGVGSPDPQTALSSVPGPQMDQRQLQDVETAMSGQRMGLQGMETAR